MRQRKTKVAKVIKVGKSSTNVPGTRAQQKRHPINKNHQKIRNKQKQRKFEMRQDTYVCLIVYRD